MKTGPAALSALALCLCCACGAPAARADVGAVDAAPAQANSDVEAGMMPESQSLALLGLSLAGIGVVRAVRQRRK